MTLLKSCCWSSIRKGCFVSALFTLVYYIVVFATCAYHVSKILGEKGIFSLSLVMLLLSGVCVVSSVLLIVGLCGEYRRMMIPWILSVTCTTIHEVIVCLYLITDSEINIRILLVLILECFLWTLKVYALMCVVSQFQVYSRCKRRTNRESVIKDDESKETCEIGMRRVGNESKSSLVEFVTMSSPKSSQYKEYLTTHQFIGSESVSRVSTDSEFVNSNAPHSKCSSPVM